MAKKPDPTLIDEDSPEWSTEDFRRARPAKEVFAELGLAMPRPRGRPRKQHPKVQVTLRLDPELVETYKNGGKGWQTRINDDLRKLAGLGK